MTEATGPHHAGDPIGGSPTFDRSVRILNQLSRAIPNTSSEGFLRLVSETACQLLSVPICIVWQRAEHEQTLRIVATAGRVDDTFRAIELNLDDPGIKQHLASGKVAVLENVADPHPNYGHSGEAKARGWVSLLSAPLAVGNRLIGMLDVYTGKPRSFDASEKELFGIFANYAALSIWHVGTRNRLERLHDLVRQMTDARDEKKVLELVLNGGLGLVGATRGWVGRAHLEAGELRVVHTTDARFTPESMPLRDGLTGQALDLRRVVTVPDVFRDPGAAKPFWSDTRSMLVIPIIVGNAEVRVGREVAFCPKPVGVFVVESSRVMAFSPEDEDLLTSLGRQAAVMVDKLEFDAKLASLTEAERGISDLDTEDEILRAALQAVTQTLGYEYASVSRVRPETNSITTEDVTGIPIELVDEFMQQAVHTLDSTDIQADVVRSNVAEVPDVSDPRFDTAIYDRFGHRELIRVFVPMRVPADNHVIGTIEAGYRRAHRNQIYERDVRMLQGFGDYIAVALAKRRVLLSLNLYLASLLGEGLSAVDAAQGSLMLVTKGSEGTGNEAADVLEIIERRGPLYNPQQRHQEFRVGEGIAGRVAQAGEPIIVADVRQDPRFVKPVGLLNFHSLLGVPIMGADGRCIGVICADSPIPNKFIPADIGRLGRFAHDVATAVKHLDLKVFVDHTRRLKQLERWHALVPNLYRLTGDMPALLAEIASAAQTLLRADLVTLYSYRQDTEAFEVPPARSGELEYADIMLGRLSQGAAPELVVRAGRPQYSETSRQDPILGGQIDRTHADVHPLRFVERERIVASAGLPLKVGDETVGVMFVNYRGPHHFKREERSLLTGFSAEVARMIKATRVIGQTMETRHHDALRDLSDAVTHRLKNMFVQITPALRRVREVPSLPDAACTDLDRALDLTERAEELNHDFEKLALERELDPWEACSGAELGSRLRRLLGQRTAVPCRCEVTPAAEALTIRADLLRLEEDLAGFVRDSERHFEPVAGRPDKDHLKLAVRIDVATVDSVQRAGLRTARRYLLISYLDNGPGVELRYKEAIFMQRFTTVRGQKRHGRDGLGLGLTIARRTAMSHGGALIEQGDFGEGIRLEMYLPVEETAHPDPAAPTGS